MANKMTISTHNGTQCHRAHNKRLKACTSKESHINPNGVHETWHDETLQKAYKRLFSDAVEQYNKGKKPSRQIKNYLEKVEEHQHKHPVYEMIIQIGDKENHPDDAVCHDILKEFYDTWNERNPNMQIIGAYYHADEETPHLHLDYVPVAHNTKGLSVENSLTKALKEQGLETKAADKAKGTAYATAQSQWIRQQNDYLEQLCSEKGFSIHHPQRDEKQKASQHQQVQEYKMAQMQEDLQDLNADIYAKRSHLAQIDEEIQKGLNSLDEIEKCLKTANNALEGISEDELLQEWLDLPRYNKAGEQVSSYRDRFDKFKEQKMRESEKIRQRAQADISQIKSDVKIAQVNRVALQSNIDSAFDIASQRMHDNDEQQRSKTTGLTF